MPPVFAHGRLRLYLLKLLDEAPRHGYEVIRLLEERFQGLYAPSAGTVYPRLAKLEAEGLVTHTTEGGRKVYSITDAGRAELAGRSGELADLELEIRESVAELAAEIRDDVRGAAGELRREVRAAAASAGERHDEGFLDSEAWQAAKEELRRAKQEWKEQTRRAKDESRRAREDAQQARRQAQEAHEKAREDVQRIARQMQDQFTRLGVRDGFSGLTSQLGDLAREATAWLGQDRDPAGGAGREPGAADWAADVPRSGDPVRDLDRLLDRFRDDVRDAARDHGVSAEQLREAHGHLAGAAEALGRTLRPGGRTG
ncbi:helix-turn-helix transcriptional regulator [Streptomyces bambusae]|uniref:PadR family transcriptional regulator n=1 Tax=Streptomyces bambusae TaxID=1550616 RepID=UPI001CFFE905|nr:PadR family transcriptional regulator [Streptomyces bambusae]MCB5169159.1 helix-turn-helix transcriptional regulator [Streptomyces bambusae]